MRLRSVIPQLSDRPESLARALYKASTGSIKSAEFLLGGLGFLVVAELGRETWADAPVGQWTAALAESWPPRPGDGEFAALLEHAFADGVIARRVALAEPELEDALPPLVLDEPPRGSLAPLGWSSCQSLSSYWQPATASAPTPQQHKAVVSEPSEFPRTNESLDLSIRAPLHRR